MEQSSKQHLKELRSLYEQQRDARSAHSSPAPRVNDHLTRKVRLALNNEA